MDKNHENNPAVLSNLQESFGRLKMTEFFGDAPTRLDPVDDRTVLDALPHPVWTTDDSGTLQFLNSRGSALFGSQESPWLERIHPDDRAAVAQAWEQSVAGHPARAECRIRLSDGSSRWHRMEIQRLPASRQCLFFAFDIEEHKELEAHRELQLEAEQTARAEAERAALLKEQFLATVSHDIRTPLTAVLGWIQLVRKGGLRPDAVPHALETIERNARAQARFMDDLLDMSRILSGRLRLDIRPVDLGAVVEAAASAIESAAAAKKVRLQRARPHPEIIVLGDSARLQQILRLLLGNAIKFTPPDGEITIGVTGGDSSAVQVSVSDSGEGISPELLPYVFDRFRQPDFSPTRSQTGLGLAIVRHLAELHGGEVRANSPGLKQGSTFLVVLPVVEPAPADHRPPPAATHIPEQITTHLDGTKILVVDDDADARDLIRLILTQNGAEIHTASSADQAVSEISGWRPDILVADIGMPGEDGYDLIRQVRALGRESGGRIPALALTGFARSSDRVHALEAGFQCHLAKPIEPALLVRAVAALSLARRGIPARV